MPVIEDFGAFQIRMYFEDHNPPHFHVVTPDSEAQVAIETLEIIAGQISPAVWRRARRWAGDNRDLLWDKWIEFSG